jgi:HSP20 family protein
MEDSMGEATAVKRVEEPDRPIQNTSLIDQIEDTFNALARRAYDIFEHNGRAFGHDLENWLRAERELLHAVPVNVTESDESLEVRAEVPGFSEKEIEVAVEPKRLTITGKRETKKEEKKGRTLHAESCANQILRMVDLPAEIDTEKVKANLKHGVLTLTMPKATKTQALRIRPNAG